MLVLKSALSTFFEVVDGAFKCILVVQLYENILTTVHATTKLFAPFFSAQDGESTNVNCLVFLSTLREWQNFNKTSSQQQIRGF